MVAIEHAIAAPLCTRQLADLGARVIKVERRETGDFARHYDSRVKGMCSHFVWTNRSKESLSLDIKHPDSTEILQRLLQRADVLVQNLAPNAAARMGLGFDTLHPRYKDLIVCNISGYGDSGPYASKKAYDLLVQAEAGFLSVTGLKDSVVKSGISIADIAAGTQAHSAILAALIQRGRTGQGSRIDISMLEAMVEWMGFPLNYAYDGAGPPKRSGADHASIFPYGAFSSAEGKVLMLGLQNEREWSDFCKDLIHRPELLNDSRFNTNSQRSDNRVALREIIQASFDTLSFEQLTRALDQVGIAYSTVNDMEAVWNHPQLRALERIIEVDSPAGKIKSFLPPGNSSSYEARIAAVPDLGQHNSAILMELGFTDSDIEKFEASKVI